MMIAKPCRFAAFPFFVLLTALGWAIPAVAAPPPTAAVPEKTEWKTYEKKAAHFSIALPPGWAVVEVDPAEMEGSLRELGRKNPELGRLLGPQVRGLAAAGVRFMAVDAAADVAKAGFATNVNVLAERMPAGMTVEQNLASNAAQIGKLAARRGELVRRMTEVGGRPAGWLEYRVLVDPTKGLEVATSQLYVAAGGQSLIVTFTTRAAQAAHYGPIFAAIAERFRVLD